MAKAGTSKQRSLDQENFISKLFRGRRTLASGASAHDPGDVVTEDELFECKQKGGAEKHATSMSVNLKIIEKTADEAWSIGKVPVLALRMYAPTSVLADRDGHVDLVVRLATDDAERG
jgi:hypothetical protein